MQERNRIIEGTEYQIAQGPAGLEAAIRVALNSQMPSTVFILFKLGDQQSLIRADLQESTCKFYYNDSLGRPATMLVKEAIQEVMVESKKKYQFFDVHAIKLSQKVSDSMSGTYDSHRVTLDFVLNQLNVAVLTNAWGQGQASKMGFFGGGPSSAIPDQTNNSDLSNSNKPS